jgi:hypothetical protein
MDDHRCLWHDILPLESTHSRPQNTKPAVGLRWHNSTASLLVHGADRVSSRRDHAYRHRVYGPILHYGYVTITRIDSITSRLTSPIGTWFPLGIALFHAANLKFLQVAELQKQFEFSAPQTRLGAREKRTTSHTSWMERWRSAKAENKVFILIGVAMVFQIILTTAMWLLCSKYHPGYGLPGTEITGATLPEQLIDLGRGWEWWPSVLWQFAWTWMVAPFLIWRAWDIRDTLGWRTQTIGACLSG